LLNTNDNSNNSQDLSNADNSNEINDSEFYNHNPMQTFFTTRKFRTSLTVPHERLVVEFVTVPFFKGQFLPYFNHLTSSFNAATSTFDDLFMNDLGDFDLELV